MAFGAYPQQQQMSASSVSKPLLVGDGASSEASDDIEYERESTFASHHARNARNKWCCRPFLARVAVATGVFVLFVQSILLWKLWHQQILQQRAAEPEALGELNNIVPSFGAMPKLFTPDPRFDPLNLSDAGWTGVMPVGGGFVEVPDWRERTLPPPIQTHGKDLYNVAVFHQLHCLHVLAEEFGNLLTFRQPGSHGDPPHHAQHQQHKESDEVGDAMMMYHIRHCFEYIKASLTCCADVALEGQKPDLPQAAADGFGSRHMCRNFDAIFDWTEAHRGSNQRGYPHPSGLA